MQSTAPDYLVAGLGNPGGSARFSLHNAGRIAASLFFGAAGGNRYRKYPDAWVGRVTVDGTSVAVVLPRTWSDASGQPVARHARRLGVPTDRVILLHDDSGSRPGHVTVSEGTEPTSHPGAKSTMKALGTSKFPRVKIGIAPRLDWNDDFHLKSLAGAEKQELLAAGQKAAVAARRIVAKGTAEAVREGAILDTDRWLQTPPDEAHVVRVPPSWRSRLERVRTRAVAGAIHGLLGTARLWRRVGQRNLRVVAVIGTYGKTTTRAAIYRSLGPQRVGTQWPWWAQFNADGGPALHLLSLWPWRKYGVIEVAGGKPGAMDMYGPVLQPDIVVMTAIGSDHLDRWPDFASKIAGKAKMLNYLRHSGAFVANCDDPRVAGVAAKFPGRVVRYGLGPEADVRAVEVALQFPDGTRFTVQIDSMRHELLIPAYGEHAVRSALAAVAVAHVERLPLAPILERLQTFVPVLGRMFVVKAPNGAWVIRDEHKAPRETFEFALDVLAKVPARRKYVVAGDIEVLPGQHDEVYRQIGSRIGQVATGLVIVGRNVERYTRAAISGGLSKSEVVAMPLAYSEAASYVTQRTGPGDVILVKGRASDRVQRVSLAILGREVRCRRYPCRSEPKCDECKMLGKP